MNKELLGIGVLFGSTVLLAMPLGRYLATYNDAVLDARRHNEITTFEISAEEGYVLQPGVLYLGVTEEYTETHAHVPFL